jgi:hypothetical protein
VFSDRAASHPPGAPLEPQVRALAAKNKCLADSNKTRHADEATNERLHPVTPTTPRSADRGRVSFLPRWRGPASRTLCASDGEKELLPMPRSRIEIYWKTPETAPDGVIAQVRVTDDSGSDYLLPYPCELTEDGWVNAASGKPLAVRVTYWKLYVETLPRNKPGKRRTDQGRQNGDLS